MKKYHLTFDFFNTFEDANIFLKNYRGVLKVKNKYLYRKNKNVHALEWTSQDQTEHKIILWYYC